METNNANNIDNNKNTQKCSIKFNNIKNIKNFKKIKDCLCGKKFFIPALFIAAALIILLFSFNTDNGEKTEKRDVAIGVLSDELEERIKDLCGSVEGVGDVHVMLTLDTSQEYVFAKDTDSSPSGTKSSYILTSSGEAIELYVIAPRVRGVAVVCSGGDRATVRKTLSELISASLGIPLSKISIAGS